MGDICTRKINQKHLNDIKMEEKIIYFMCLLMDLSILYEITEIYCIILLSLPSWERGLKCVNKSLDATILQSLPSWERGLKLFYSGLVDIKARGRSLRGSVD
mgnify:CR=1 FL=1